MFTEAQQVARRNGDTFMVAYAQLGLALTSTRAGDALAATKLHGAADAIYEKLGTRIAPLEGGLRDADIATLRRALGDELFETTYEQGRSSNLSSGTVLA